MRNSLTAVLSKAAIAGYLNDGAMYYQAMSGMHKEYQNSVQYHATMAWVAHRNAIDCRSRGDSAGARTAFIVRDINLKKARDYKNGKI